MQTIPSKILASVVCFSTLCRSAHFIITSSNENIFCVTDPLCGYSPGTGEFASQRPVTRSFDVFFDLCLNKDLSKQSWGWWFETPSRSLWHHRNVLLIRLGWNYSFWYKSLQTRLLLLLVTFTISPCDALRYFRQHNRDKCTTQARHGLHDDIIKWKHLPRYWPFVRGIHRPSVNSPQNGQWRGALIFSLICVWINGWVNNREAGDLRRYFIHCDVTVMISQMFMYICYLVKAGAYCRLSILERCCDIDGFCFHSHTFFVIMKTDTHNNKIHIINKIYMYIYISISMDNYL